MDCFVTDTSCHQAISSLTSLPPHATLNARCCEASPTRPAANVIVLVRWRCELSPLYGVPRSARRTRQVTHQGTRGTRYVERPDQHQSAEDPAQSESGGHPPGAPSHRAVQ